MATEGGVVPSVVDWQGSSELHPYFVCDVFTSRPLEGNQFGVFVDGLAALLGRQQEDGLGELQLAGEGLHLLGAERPVSSPLFDAAG